VFAVAAPVAALLAAALLAAWFAAPTPHLDRPDATA
jgi:hypothetical protein